MSIRSWRLAPTTNLARARLVLASNPARRRWVWGALVVVACAAGAAGSHVYWVQRFDQLQEQAVALKDVQALQRQLEQSRLQLRVSDARSDELEHQIDALNQKLRESQEELTFFRKARDGKH
jgi:uncharacterized protein HemX